MLRYAEDSEVIEKAVWVYRSFGPAGEHNYYCACCRKEMAVWDMNTGILQPCWGCQKQGYEIRKLSRFQKWIARIK